MIHAISLILTSIVKDNIDNSRLLHASLLGFLSGTFFFSGSLYLISISGYGFLGIVAPIGGILLVAAWGLLAAGVLRSNKVAKNSKY